MANFSVVLLTAVPSGLGAEASANAAFVKIDGRESLLRSVELFLNRDAIKQIQLVVTPEAMEESKRKFGAHLGFSGVKLLSGGPKWADQLAAAAENMKPEITQVIVHDAARPSVAYNDIDALLAEGVKHPVTMLTAPVRNPLIQVEGGDQPISLHSATEFRQILTPWCLEKSRFLELAKSRLEPSAGEITLLPGSHLNVRVNGPSDAQFVKAMINMLPKPKMRALDNPFEEAQW
jgi:2-C-methyl-D-erythritol 4-phosphate cytidylyltransferase